MITMVQCIKYRHRVQERQYMKVFINILLGVCTVGSIVIAFIPLAHVLSIKIKWIVLAIMLVIIIFLWLINMIIKEKERNVVNDKVYITDIKFINKDIIIYFDKNQIYHVDALVCVYEEAIPNPKLIAFGEVGYCENNYTTIKIIKKMDNECFAKFRNNRSEMIGKIFVITSFKRSYIKLLNKK